MLGSVPPLASWFVSRDLDEIREATQGFGAHRRSADGRGGLDYRLAFLRTGESAVGWGQTTNGQRVVATSRFPLLHLHLRSRAVVRVGRKVLDAGPGQVVFLPAGTEYELHYRDGLWVAFQLVAERLAERVVACRGAATAGEGIEPAERRLAPEQVRDLDRILQGLMTKDPELLRHRAAEVDSRLTCWVAGVLAPWGSRSGPQAAGQRRLERVEEWIDAHLDGPISTADLCAVAEIGERGLLKAFRNRRGMPPLAWVASRRLARSRLRLIDARPEDTVTRIATDLGFTHLGRYSVRYRQAYGESPSTTLRRVTEASSPKL